MSSVYWDLAATEKTELNDPDWTVGVKLGRDKKSGGYWLLDAVRVRANPGDVERLLLDTAARDGKRVTIGFGQDPGQAGKSQAQYLVRLSNFTVTPATESGDKRTRFGPFSSECRAGNVKILRGPWNEDLFRVLEGFPDLAHDDEVDACSGALEMLNPAMKGWGVYELYRQQAEQAKAQREAAAAPVKPTYAIGSKGVVGRTEQAALTCPHAPAAKTCTHIYAKPLPALIRPSSRW
jgi:predicted phage terminase large subunit-like protein